MNFHKKLNFNFFYLITTLIIITPLTTYSFADYQLSFEQQLQDECPNLAVTTLNEYQTRNPLKKKNDWTLIIYMAADNDLSPFAVRNIKQLVSIGSNQYINIAIHLDIRIGNQKTTRRYFVEKNKLVHVNVNDPATQKMDSGDPNTLISCCKWAIESYPAYNYALVLWNHGLGPIDPSRGKIINPSQLFTFNPFINKFELDRSVGFLDLLSRFDEEQRGICWDDSTGNYLTNQKLDAALKTICTKYLEGKKFSIIGFDACLMSMIEIANIIKPYADIMVSSQEVELGTGWNYRLALEPFQRHTMDKISFAQQMVEAYGNAYQSITNDYTQAAINLNYINKLEANINNVANLLLNCLHLQSGSSVKKGIKISANKLLCTHFEEPSFKDLHHLYSNLLNNLVHFTFTNKQEGEKYKEQLKTALQDGCALIKESVIANRVGKNLNRACGISIYLPERKIHPSYRRTTFAQTNAWISFMTKYLLL